ncbi:hypothetical protein I306_06906 [Cryptococcus gattii EJB2]|uniref:Uncharacterized protein n=1 Tax=Cryptococcus gattii EJB2 TaxID=1296103 RepID=A0ABR5BKE4_9TREE|nr:hypothetical protein I306_06906 [Cryptococcus gattii EJB2]
MNALSNLIHSQTLNETLSEHMPTP